MLGALVSIFIIAAILKLIWDIISFPFRKKRE